MMVIVYDGNCYVIDNVSCPIIFDSNTIELTVHTSCYFGLRLTLCYMDLASKIAEKGL